jgi:diacylglycerol kinase family enzyme
MPLPAVPVLGSSPPLFIVLNAGSGKSDTAEVRRTIEQACEAAGRRHRIFLIDGPGRIQALAKEAVECAKAEKGIVVAAGGDGTINTVAQATLGTGCVFGVLPQGTFNYFSRANGIPAETEAALKVLLEESPREVQVGLVNDRVFLVNASMGLYAELLEEREAVKREYGRSRAIAFGAALLMLFRGHRQWDLHLDSHGERRDIRTPTLFVGNNPLQLRQVGIEEAEQLENDRQLAAVALKPAGTFGLAMLLLRGMFGRMGGADSVTSFAFETLTVEPRHSSRAARSTRPKKVSRVKVATDGELGWLDMPLVFRISPDPLWLIRPEIAPELEAAKK